MVFEFSKSSSAEMLSLPFPTRFKWKHLGERTNIGEISSEFLCGPRCFLLVRCQNTWFLLVYCQHILILSHDPLPLRNVFDFHYQRCSILILNPYVISYCSYLGEVAGFLAGSVVSTTGGTVFSSSSATSGSDFRVAETAGSERSNGGHGQICNKIQQIESKSDNCKLNIILSAS